MTGCSSQVETDDKIYCSVKTVGRMSLEFPSPVKTDKASRSVKTDDRISLLVSGRA